MALADLSAATMRWLCAAAYIGYSQLFRNDIYDGGSMDCSSGAAYSYNAGGVTPPFPADTSTHNFRERSIARGFAVLDYAAVGPYPDNLAVGDALLSELASGGVGHIAVVTGYNEVSEAWIAETGDIHGEPGDQTGGETRVVSFTDHPYTLNGSWTHVLRPPVDGDDTAPTQTTPTTTNTTKENHNMFLISTPLSDGSWSYALITETSGACTLDDQQKAAYIRMLGDARGYPWDWYWLLIREAWERHNALAATVGRETDEAADSIVARLQSGLTPKEA